MCGSTTSGVSVTTTHTRFLPTRRSGQRAGHMTEKCRPYFARCARTPGRNSLRSSTSARPATYDAPGSRFAVAVAGGDRDERVRAASARTL